MKIVESGKAVCGIVLPTNPTPRELFAADELIKYVEKISGVRLEIADTYANKIVIGEPDKNASAAKILTQAEFDAQVPGPEGFMIIAKGDTLLLAGSSKHPTEKERGTVYSVYYFLEQYLGCSLSAYSKADADAGEYISQLKDIIVARPFGSDP